MTSPGNATSSFSFRAFKVDSVSLQMRQDLAALELAPGPGTDWEVGVSVRVPTFFSKPKIYVCGVDCTIYLFLKGAPAKTPEHALVTLTMGGVGSFFVSGEPFTPELEKSIVRLQFPALIFAHLRASAMSLLSTAGYGSVLLPLMNMHEVSKQTLGETPINVISG